MKKMVPILLLSVFFAASGGVYWYTKKSQAPEPDVAVEEAPPTVPEVYIAVLQGDTEIAIDTTKNTVQGNGLSLTAIAGRDVSLREFWFNIQLSILQLWYSYALLYLIVGAGGLIAAYILKSKQREVPRIVSVFLVVFLLGAIANSAYVLIRGGNYVPSDAWQRLNESRFPGTPNDGIIRPDGVSSGDASSPHIG